MNIKNNGNVIKHYLGLIEKLSLYKDFETFQMTLNNKACFFSNIGHDRTAKGIMIDMTKVKVVKLLKEDIQENNNTSIVDSNISDLASSFSQLCTFENKLKAYNDSLLSGMQSLALNQFTYLNNLYSSKNLKKRFNIEEEHENNKEEEDTYKETSSNENKPTINLILSYYNIGVQQEFLKRFKDSDISFKKSFYYAELNPVLMEHPFVKHMKRSTLLEEESFVNSMTSSNSTNQDYNNQNNKNVDYEMKIQIGKANKLLNIKAIIK